MLSTVGDVDRRGLESAEQLLADGTCAAVVYAAQIPSTSTAALCELREGTLADGQLPKLYLTDHQTAGRGRHGRQWVSTSGTLTFSLVADHKSSLTSLAVSVGVARCLEFDFAPLRTQLKWPNDVYLCDGKVAGILLEASPAIPGRVVIGVGINVGDSPDLADVVDQNSAQNLAEVVGRRIDRYSLLVPLVENILHAIDQIDTSSDELLGEFRSRCCLTGYRIRFRQGAQQREGFCRGVSDEGELIIDTDDGIHHLASGEATLVRATDNSM